MVVCTYICKYVFGGEIRREAESGRVTSMPDRELQPQSDCWIGLEFRVRLWSQAFDARIAGGASGLLTL